MKTILITGGAGYIGSHTVVEFIQSGYQVFIIDDFSNSDPCVISSINKITQNDIKLFRISCNDDLSEVFEMGVEAVIHFAAHKAVGESVEQPLKYYRNNLTSLINLLEHCQKFKFSSSCSVYGNLTKLPATETSPLSTPESPYANTKLIGEQILKDFCLVNKDFKAISLRYFNPVGAHESGLIGELSINKPNNILPVICNSIKTGQPFQVFGNDYPTQDGSCVRDYVHVSDIAQAHVKAFENLNKISANYEVYNLGFSGQGLTVFEIIKSFEETNNVKLNYTIGPRRSGDVVTIYSDSKKAHKELNWFPTRNIQDMVSSVWKWHKNQQNQNF